MNTPVPTLRGDPIPAAACTDDWLAERRALIARAGYALRAGAGLTIEIKTLTPIEQMAGHDRLRVNQWLALQLPADAACFATEQDRDAVLATLQQGHP